MTWILVAIGCVVLLPLIAFVIGWSMPERFEGSAHAVYDVPRERVWEALADVDRYPMTGKAKKDVLERTEPGGLAAWTENMGHGQLVRVETVAAREPKSLARTMEARGMPLSSRWDYTLELAGADGCRLSIEAETRIPSGSWQAPLLRLMMVLGGGVKKGLDTQLDMLRDTLHANHSRKRRGAI